VVVKSATHTQLCPFAVAFSVQVSEHAYPMDTRARHIKACGLANGKDRHILAFYTHWNRGDVENHREAVERILQSPGEFRCTAVHLTGL
jgi:hypothetical protein